MSEKFVKKWTKEESTPVKSRVKTSLHPPPPLKPRLDNAVRGIQVQIQRLEQVHLKLTDRDKAIFSKVVDAYSKHDTTHASIYSNELAEIRKMAKMIVQARLALEQIVLRLSTVNELGEIVVTLAPAMSVVRSIKSSIGGVLPEAEQELGEIGSLLSSLLIDAGQTSGFNINFESANADAQQIMAEAATIAEQKVKDKFPELPTGFPTTERPAGTSSGTA